MLGANQNPFPVGRQQVAPLTGMETKTELFQVTRGRVVPKRKDATNNAIVANQTHDTLTLEAETNYAYEIMDICVIPDSVPDGQLPPTSNLYYMDLLIEDRNMIRGLTNTVGKNSFPFPTSTSFQAPLLRQLRQLAMVRMLTSPPDPQGIRDGRNLLYSSRFWVDEGEKLIAQFKATSTAVANAYYVMLRYKEYLQTGVEKQAKWLPGGTASQMKLFYSVGTNNVAGVQGSAENRLDKALNPKSARFPYEDVCPDNRWYEIWAIGVVPAANQEETSITIDDEGVGADINVGFLTNPQINELPFGSTEERTGIQALDEPIVIIEGQKLNLFFENDSSVNIPVAGTNVVVIGVEHLMSL